MFSDAVVALPDVALRALDEASGGKVVFVGGAAASYPPGGETFVYFNDEVLRDALVLCGAERSFGTRGCRRKPGWNPVGKPGRITKAAGNLIYEIDEAPAMEFYYRRLGKDAEVFLGSPLGILEPDGSVTVRAPISVDHGRQTIHISGSVREGDSVQVLYAQRR